MIYGKIWCVVKPSVGIPLFLGGVAVGSFAVHVMLLSTAGWLKQYYQGNAKPTASIEQTAPVASAAPTSITVAQAQK